MRSKKYGRGGEVCFFLGKCYLQQQIAFSRNLMSNISVNFPNTPSGLDAMQNRALSNNAADDQNAAIFADLLSPAPAADFKSRFDNLTPAQQDRIRIVQANFEQATNSAQAALQLANESTVEMNELASKGDFSTFFEKFPAYQQLVTDADSAVKNTTAAGLALLDTLENIDSTLPQSLPDFGTNLLALLKKSGGSEEQINRVATAFGIS
jgi:hypothetical protein